MLADPEGLIFLGLSGAMIPGGMGTVIRGMIEMNLIDVLVSTGANVFHDLFENHGFRHYLGNPGGDDDLLRRHRIVRFYDALMRDHEINQVIRFLSRVPKALKGRTVSTREYLSILGRHRPPRPSILKSAAVHEVPVFVPAISDSSIGIGLTFLHARNQGTPKGVLLDPIRDNYEIAQIKRLASTTGAIYIGGGVPKNYIQQLGPVNELLFGRESSHRYAFQITTDDPKWGGLSGCTFEEAKSWGKIGQQSEYAVAYLDATIALPLLVGALLQGEKKLQKRKRRRLIWEENVLKSIEFVSPSP